jgi:hypothetical protein
MQLRHRIEELCRARGADFKTIDVGIIVEPSLRIDRADDLVRLRASLERHQPRLLILDPYVRLQSADENNATEVAAILARLREISRTYSTALLLVHHSRKSSGERAGQALRGSSDFHAWGDSNLYLRRRAQDIILTTEHRAAAAPPPIALALEEDPLRLDIVQSGAPAHAANPLEERLLDALANGPRRLDELRSTVGARKQSVALALRALEESGSVIRRHDGWARVPL